MHASNAAESGKDFRNPIIDGTPWHAACRCTRAYAPMAWRTGHHGRVRRPDATHGGIIIDGITIEITGNPRA
jgi:hypothetical protein